MRPPLYSPLPPLTPISFDSFSEALTDAPEGACAPHRPLETRWPCASTRSSLGGEGKPWRIGTEVYSNRGILPRDVISRKSSVNDTTALRLERGCGKAQPHLVQLHRR